MKNHRHPSDIKTITISQTEEHISHWRVRIDYKDNKSVEFSSDGDELWYAVDAIRGVLKGESPVAKPPREWIELEAK